MRGGAGGRGGKEGDIPDERRGGGLTLAGKGTELKRLLDGGNWDPSDGVTWMTISIFAL
jgi:hypothetical protein